MNINSWDSLKIPEGIRVPYFGGKWYELISKMERKYIKNLPIGGLTINDNSCNERIIVSLTTFPARINVVGYAIKSLLHQTMKPDRIILWLAQEQFPDKVLPDMLKELQECGLEIEFCEKDLRSHKKYHYILQQQREDELVITYDDDLIYPEDSIERLYQTHVLYPECIIANRASCIEMDHGTPKPYSTWRVHSAEGVRQSSRKLFPSTGGGVLYPYGSVNKEAFNIQAMMECAFSADDLWMRIMSAMNGTEVVKTRKDHRTFTVLDGSQTESLQVQNCLEGGNDAAIRALMKHYPEAFRFIVGDSE